MRALLPPGRDRPAGRPRAILGALLLGLALLAPAAPAPGARVPEYVPPAFHAGELLIASPNMQDPRFRRSVIILVRHDRRGAFGLVVNRVVGSVKLAGLFARFGFEPPDSAGEIDLHYGGPVRRRLGFVLHSTEAVRPAERVGKKVGVSPLKRILRAIAKGEGPRRLMFALGYAGWGPGQLEAEMRKGAWFTAPADEDILFDEEQGTKWRRAMERRYRWL